ncbi:hypothetical protein [Paenarthrobacter nitroguajacolicus]|uniref:hypothetical protein n=1 Tax=Paenarthrobacter nitroguajacolicus TaxID=211146 RepID=UPI000A837911|nr:hypothetical protein [Paenarthrobacter nitroguajacolicus]
MSNKLILIGELRTSGFVGSSILMLPYLGQGGTLLRGTQTVPHSKRSRTPIGIIFFDRTEKMPDVPTPLQVDRRNDSLRGHLAPG